AAGGEILHLQTAVGLGEHSVRASRRSEAQGAEAAQAETGVPVRMALLLAGVEGHRRREDLFLRAHVHQEIGMRGMIDLVEQDAQAAERLILIRETIIAIIAQRREEAMERGEGGAVIA